MPILLKSPENTMEFGAMLAQAMAASSLRTLYLFAELGGGKTTFTRGFVSALPGGDNAEVASPSFTLCNVYPTRPEVLHADLYRLSEGATLPEEMEEMLDEGDPFLILEWPQYLAADRYASERLDIHLSPVQGNGAKALDKTEESCKTFRLATIEARGEAAEKLLSELMGRLEKRFLPAHEA
ncbi:tRNA (adenosine(37)-N6)-threonylcarbamoyltransferase complex ATPase subunit type 1 TsaE [uncultured Mailhella sp.]|uniref:tRNA (adenosine(37)-N6)-threonylcarbamoyltransferase complex ATPase subunit type 1 TsaE n=1 Tax=uncultured Mailhella sp. TaxID=1981031 RepID=UPI0025EDED93|nr:tRNA (adenosine(37)-N6)-threonylcarbamoyltransferase complex ATPase subunit type 1 TsaE [uncultured Mailhella sp.]